MVPDGIQGLHDTCGDVRLIHRINMDMSDTIGDQINDLLRCIDDSGLLHLGRVISEAVNHHAEALRNRGAGKGDASGNLLPVGDGHDAGKNRNINSCLANAVQEVVEHVVVEEHLRGQKVQTGIDLFLQITDVSGRTFAFHMSLWIAGTADAEAVVDGLDVVNQLTGMIVFENRTALFPCKC